MMHYRSKILFLFLFCYAQNLLSLTISTQDAYLIGNKIWKNECGGTIEGLTSWNKGENFPSLGIGHFIWYPANQKDRFQETFPELLIFLKKEMKLPAWLEKSNKCPWNSRENFYQNIQSEEMKNLRQFLFDTRHLQAIFIANRLDNTFPRIIENCKQEQQDQIKAIYSKLIQSPNGCYALIDYINFKGEGISSDETYKGEGWGLLQVLQKIPATSETAVVDFVKAAKEVLDQRVQNSPPERNEQKWLKGWFNRLDTYLK